MSYERDEYSRLMEWGYVQAGRTGQPADRALFDRHRASKPEVNQPCDECGEPWPCAALEGVFLGLAHQWGYRATTT